MDAKKVDAHAVFRAFTACPADPKTLILDVRANKEFKKKHVCLSYNVRLSTNGKVLADYSQNSYDLRWSQDCWWAKHVVVYGDKELRKDHPVVAFLAQEARCMSLSYYRDGFEAFEQAYPFLCTASVKSSAARSYPSQMVPGLLYLGNWAHAQDLERLQELNIKRVITVHNHPENLKLPATTRHLKYQLADIESADISPLLGPAFDFIEQAQARKEAVLVHCGAGVSRSATIVMAYLMRAQRISAAKARQQVTALRSVVCINDGFWRTLCALEAPLDLAERSDPAQGTGFHGADASADAGAAAVGALGQEVLGEKVPVVMVTAKELEQQEQQKEGQQGAAAGAAQPPVVKQEIKQEDKEAAGADKPRRRSRSRSRSRGRRQRSRSRERDRARRSSRSRSRSRERRRSRSRDRGRERGRSRSRSRDRRDERSGRGGSGSGAAAAPQQQAAAPAEQLQQQQQPAAAKPKGGRIVTLEVHRGDTLVGQLRLGPMRLHHKCIFGRAPSCDVVLEHLSVSRAHTQLSVDSSGQVLVMDLGSGHGTNLDGAWLKANALRQMRVGSVIKFGASTRTYKLLSVAKQE